MSEIITSIRITNDEELTKVLAKIEKQGFIWNSRTKPTKFKPTSAVFPYFIQMWDDNTITYGSNKRCEYISADEFLKEDKMNTATEYKFNVGDRVRVLDGSKIKNYTGNWCMDEHIGKIFTVKRRYTYPLNGKNAYKLDDEDSYTWDERGLELVEDKPKEQEGIKRGDIVKAMLRLMHEDESTKELTNEMPAMILVFGIVAGKLEDMLFGEEE